MLSQDIQMHFGRAIYIKSRFWVFRVKMIILFPRWSFTRLISFLLPLQYELCLDFLYNLTEICEGPKSNANNFLLLIATYLQSHGRRLSSWNCCYVSVFWYSTLLTLWLSIQHCLKLFVLLFCSVMYLKFSVKRILSSLTAPSSLFPPSVLARTSTGSEAACLREPAFLSVSLG